MDCRCFQLNGKSKPLLFDIMTCLTHGRWGTSCADASNGPSKENTLLFHHSPPFSPSFSSREVEGQGERWGCVIAAIYGLPECCFRSNPSLQSRNTLVGFIADRLPDANGNSQVRKGERERSEREWQNGKQEKERERRSRKDNLFCWRHIKVLNSNVNGL